MPVARTVSPPTPPPPRWLARIDPAWLRLLVFFGALTLLLVLVIVFDEIFAPLLMGLAIAYLFDPLVTWFERRGLSRSLGVVAVMAILLLFLAAFFMYLVPAIGEQVKSLGSRLPQYRTQLEAKFAPWIATLQQQFPEEMGSLEQRLRSSLSENLPDVAGRAGKMLGALAGNALRFLLVLLNLIFVPVFAFYLLVDFPKIKRAAVDLVPIPYRPTVLERAQEVDGAVAGFLRGQLTIALILAAINATGMMVIGVPMGIVIGIVAGLANMIPYMALVVGLTPALLLCWVEHQSLGRLAAVAAVFAGAQFLEGTVLSPRILGKNVNLHPVWVLLAVIAGGSLFGFIGMLVAVPTAAAIQVFARHWLAAYKSSAVYRGDGPRPGRQLLRRARRPYRRPTANRCLASAPGKPRSPRRKP